MSDEDEWSDDYVIDEDVPILQSKLSYEVLKESDISDRQGEAINKLAEELGFSYSQAAILLIQHQWNPQRVLEKIMDNSVEIPLLRRASSKTLSENVRVLCILCYKTVAGPLMIALECGHAFCENCYREYLTEAIISGPESIFTKCPMDECNIIVPQELFQTLLPGKLFNKYKMFVFRSFVDNRSDVKWCPAPGCTCAASYPKGKSREITCDCGYSWCFGCGKESHRPLSCDLLLKWNQKMIHDDDSLWLLANTKSCPKCKNAIQKNLGCMHMTCRCGYQFCWLCLGDWLEHNEKTGGSYQCNIFQGNQKQGKYDKLERDRAKAALSLQRFEHYYNRFINHKASLKEAKIKNTRIKVSVTNMYEIFKEANLFDFYNEASELVLNAKQSLAYSYAYGYYLTSNAKIRFYEFIQGELESNMIRLDTLIDQSLECFIISDEFAVSLLPQFSGFRMNVINLTNVVHTHFDECLKQMESGFPNIKDGYEENKYEDDIEVGTDINFSDKWICGACTLANDLKLYSCTACQTKRRL